jgi:hypothetical protein
MALRIVHAAAPCLALSFSFIAAIRGEAMHTILKRIFQYCRRLAPQPGGRAALAISVLTLVAGTTTAQALERADAITLGSGVDRIQSLMTAPDGRTAFALSESGPGLANHLVKIDLARFEAVGDVNYAPGDWASTPRAVLDSAGHYAYITYLDAMMMPTVAKVDVTTMQRVASSAIGFMAMSLVIDSEGLYAYTGSDEGVVEKIHLPSLQVVGQVQTGQAFLRSAAIDPLDANLYLGTYTAPGRVVKIDLATFQWAGVLTFTGGEVGLRSVVVDRSGTAAYFGTYTNPSFPALIAKVDLATFQPAGNLTFDSDVIGLATAAVDVSGQYAYFGSTTYPPRVLKIDLATFSLADTLVLAGDDGALRSFAMSVDGHYAYTGTDDVPGKVIKLALLQPAPDLLRFVPAYLDFHNVELGGSAIATVTLQNAGTQAANALQLGALPAGVMADSSACGVSLGAGSSCAIQLSYQPLATGTFSVNWGVSSAQGGSVHLSLLGRAIPVHRNAEITPAVLDFGVVALGATATQSFMLTNTSGGALAGIFFHGADSNVFQVDGTTCHSLAVGASCVVAVHFSPRTVTPVSASLQVLVAGADVEAQLALAGSGMQTTNTLAFDNAAVSFAPVPVGQTARRSVMLKNFGTSTATNLVLTPSNSAFTVTTVWCDVITTLGSCMIDLGFTPTVAGSASATFEVRSAQGGHAQVALSGVGTGNLEPPDLAFDLLTLDFGQVGIATPNWRTVVLRNNGSGAAIFTGFFAPLPFAINGSACAPALSPGDSCTVRVGMQSGTPGPQNTIVMAMTDQGPGAQLSVQGTASADVVFKESFD